MIKLTEARPREILMYLELEHGGQTYEIECEVDAEMGIVNRVSEINGNELPDLAVERAKRYIQHCNWSFEASGERDPFPIPIDVVVAIKGGTFHELWTNRSNVNIHKIDIDKDSEDPVLYQKVKAETIGNPMKMVQKYQSEFK